MMQQIKSAGELYQAWEKQQTAYVRMRAWRTATVVDGLRRVADGLDRPMRVLDIACGPGSLSKAILAAFPFAEVVGVDRDPVLLRLARETSTITVIDADLTGDWVAALPRHDFDAVVSATALHWLDPQDLVALYLRLPQVLVATGVFFNCDHLFFDATANPISHEWAAHYREISDETLGQSGAMDWDAWWAAALALPGWESEAAAHRARWADKHRTVPVSVEFHLAALRAAGFTEAAQIWQWFDDRIIFASLAAE